MNETKAHENPLVPNKKLRQIYTLMVEARLLDEHIAVVQRKAKARHRLHSTIGQEACRVTTAIELAPGDLISDSHMSATMDLLFGAKLTPLLQHIAAVVSGSKARTTMLAEKTVAGRQLQWIEDASDRLKIAIGAALTFKTMKQANIVVAYVQLAEVPKKLWNQIFALAAKLNVPMIFVVLAETDNKKVPKINICAKARSAGIPAIPVDTNDAVALYRVAQESIGRSRGGDGPVLIECISCRPVGQRSNEMDDPILHMKNFIIGREVCSEDWVNHAADGFRKRIAAANR